MYCPVNGNTAAEMTDDSQYIKSYSLKAGTEKETNYEESEAEPGFEEVLDSVGSRGKFQRKLNIVFNAFGSCFNLMSVNIFYLAMQTPDHWCHVPGRQKYNLSLEQWKNFTIPKKKDSFSMCLMYNNTDVSSVTTAELIPCQHGWDYDDTWFSQTIPSQMNWVCNNTQPVNDVLFYAQNLGVVLGLLFGYIGDMYGRRPQQLLCLAAHVVSRLLIVLTPHVLVILILAESLVCAAAGPMLESALSVGAELTDMRYRTVVNLSAHSSMGVSLMLAGLLAWALASSTYFLSAAACCCLALFFFHRWFPESPRWLACRGRDEDAMKLLQRIAQTNGGTVPAFTQKVLHKVARSKMERQGFLSIFSSWNVIKNTVIISISKSVYLLTMYSMMLATGSLSGNPFVAIAMQGVTQVGAFFLVSFTASGFGRRWSSVAASLIAMGGAAGVVIMLSSDVAGVGPILMAMLMQFGATANLAMANLQSVEVHPTCLRQIAASVEWALAGIMMSALPYIALTGGAKDKRLPFVILGALNLFAAFSASFLPESALQRLPETLHDAAVFGKRQRFWSWKPKPDIAFTPT